MACEMAASRARQCTHAASRNQRSTNTAWRNGPSARERSVCRSGGGVRPVSGRCTAPRGVGSRAWQHRPGLGDQREASGFDGHDLVVRPVLPGASRLSRRIPGCPTRSRTRSSPHSAQAISLRKRHCVEAPADRTMERRQCRSELLRHLFRCEPVRASRPRGVRTGSGVVPDSL